MKTAQFTPYSAIRLRVQRVLFAAAERVDVVEDAIIALSKRVRRVRVAITKTATRVWP